MEPTPSSTKDFGTQYIGEDTIKICLDILNNNVSMEPLNKTHITLIQKMKDPKKMSEFRLISLCNVSYKIVAKALANRLKKVLDSIIAQNQSAFVPGRQITDNVIVGFKCLHSLNNRRRGKTGHVVIKLDMSKAYNRVEWIQKIMDCISTVTYSILINGSPQEEFKPCRGIRQG